MKPEDEQARIKERERAAEAQRIMDSQLWQEAYEKLARELNNAMLNSASDEETLEAKKQLLLLHKVRKHFENVLTTGRMAVEQLEKDHGRS